WHALGAGMWGVLALSVLAATGTTLCAMRVLRNSPADSRVALALIGGTAALALVAALTWPVLFSSDVYAYAAYGDEALRGIDPSAPLPAQVSDPILRAANWQWSGTF